MAELSITRGHTEPTKEAKDNGSCRAWSITINNPTDADIESWKHAKALHWVKDAIGQLEKGKNGTLHIQGLLKTDKVRHAQVCKAFPRAHVEAARNQNALEVYVQKPETRVATIATAKIATASDIQRELAFLAQDQIETHYPGHHMADHIVRKHIEKHWETLLDTTVERLMLQGYYGAEFVVCNPQVRGAYRRYIYPMIIREIGAQQLAKDNAEKTEEKCEIE